MKIYYSENIYSNKEFILLEHSFNAPYYFHLISYKNWFLVDIFCFDFVLFLKYLSNFLKWTISIVHCHVSFWMIPFILYFQIHLTMYCTYFLMLHIQYFFFKFLRWKLFDQFFYLLMSWYLSSEFIISFLTFLIF